MLPQGAGEKNGQNWENALSYAAAENSLEQAWQQLQPGATRFSSAVANTKPVACN
tara:strand:- start:199 stop:363 length:165 start_codon:yes stop_codon:yes gene_type:complete